MTDRELKPWAPAYPCTCDERGDGVPGVSCGDCPRDYGHRVEPPNLYDPAVRHRLATQWGYVRAAQPEQQYHLPDDLYPDSKDWRESNYAGRVEWLHTMYEAKKRECEMWVEQINTQADHMRDALELIAAPMRPDGTWNRDRLACQQIAEKALRVTSSANPQSPAASFDAAP